MTSGYNRSTERVKRFFFFSQVHIGFDAQLGFNPFSVRVNACAGSWPDPVS